MLIFSISLYIITGMDREPSIYVTSLSVFHTEATVYLGYPGSLKKSLEYQNKVRFLIQQIRENRLRHTRGSV